MRNAEDARRHAEWWCAYLCGDLDVEAERRCEDEFLEDAEACGELYREFNVDACLRALAPPPSPKPELQAPPRISWPKLAVAVGITMSVGALAWWAGSSGPPSPPSQSAQCQPIEPEGRQSSFPTQFRWSRAEGAARYRLVLKAPSGTVHFEATVSDTLFFLPESARPKGTVAGRWSWYLEPISRSGRIDDRSDVVTFESGG
jgi:hypothetical protein